MHENCTCCQHWRRVDFESNIDAEIRRNLEREFEDTRVIKTTAAETGVSARTRSVTVLAAPKEGMI